MDQSIAKLSQEISEKLPPLPLSNIHPNNGFILCDTFLPDDLLTVILSFVNKKALVKQCRFVCKKWNYLIKRNVWKIKAERKYQKLFSELKLKTRLPWGIYYNMIWKNSYGRNLLKIDNRQLGLKNWPMVPNGENDWLFESFPFEEPEIEAANRNPNTNYVTASSMHQNSQMINLVKKGITPYIMDTYQPTIFISDRFRVDLGSFYELDIELLDDKQEKITHFNFKADMSSYTESWKKINHTFESYGPGVRYICFEHTGYALWGWFGHYESKMTNALVEIPFSALNRMQIKRDVEF